MARAGRRSLIGRALLSLALWAGFWVLGLGLVTGLAAIPVLQALYGDSVTLPGVLAGLGAVAVAWSLRPRFAPQAGKRPAPLGREEFPELHALVAELARRSGAPEPGAIHLSVRANASIWVERRWLGLRRTWRVELGLPLLALLDREELAAVLAHELGHHCGGDLVLGAWVHRTHASLGAALDGLDESAFLLDAPFRAYWSLFLRASRTVSREQELAADAHAAALCGVRAAAGALRAIHDEGDAWEVFLAQDAAPLLDRGVRLPLLEGFRRFRAEPDLREEVRRALAESSERPPSPTDTHPRLEERLAALGPASRFDRLGPPGAPGSALALLGGEEAAETAWYERAAVGGLDSLKRLGWDEVGTAVVLPGIAEALAQTALPAAAHPLSALPALVRDAEGVWRTAVRGVNLLSPASRRRQGLRLLADWLADALARRGFALEVGPGAPPRLRRGDEAVEPRRVVEGLASGEWDEARYLAACAAWEAGAPAATA
jgi:Zn-dependent protease with chaperone function